MFGFIKTKNKYQLYKNAVLKRLSKTFNITASMQHEIESWIRDYFIDNIEVNDCVHAIRHNVHECMTIQKEHKLLTEAKIILKENGYNLEK